MMMTIIRMEATAMGAAVVDEETAVMAVETAESAVVGTAGVTMKEAAEVEAGRRATKGGGELSLRPPTYQSSGSRLVFTSPS